VHERKKDIQMCCSREHLYVCMYICVYAALNLYRNICISLSIPCIRAVTICLIPQLILLNDEEEEEEEEDEEEDDDDEEEEENHCSFGRRMRETLVESFCMHAILHALFHASNH
jgi:hypothetical protein